MKPSHLAAIVLAGIGIGGMASAGMPTSNAIVQSSQGSSKAVVAIQNSAREMQLAMMRGGMAYGEAPPSSWRRKNQRQIRLNRRRAHAAGKRNAFA